MTNFTRAQEKQLDRMLKEKGIDKQEFIAQQLANKAMQASQQQMLRHPKVLKPADPITGRRAKSSRGPFGPHTSGRFGFLWRKRRMWIETPLVVHLFQGTVQQHITDGSRGNTVWASSESRGW
jgi:hypothetical protein